MSLRGMAIYGKMGLTLTPRTYQRHKIKALRREEQRVAAIFFTNCVFFWIDNFNKFFKKSYLSITNGPRIIVDWTPCGISRLPGTNFNQLCHKFDRRTGFLKECFPEQVLQINAVRDLLGYFHQWNNFQNLRLWQTSEGTVHQVFTTPLRLEAGLPTQEEIIFGSNCGLKNFFPVDLLSEAVNSSAGLCGVLRKLRQKYWAPGHYFLLKVDVDLYWRIAKVN